MPKAIYLYTKFPFHQLETIVDSHKENFEHLLEETFDEDELSHFEGKLDEIGAIYAQPILSELSFEDFYADDARELEQRTFFDSCKSSILLENVPDLESNAFQVSYLKLLLTSLPETLIDTGGMNTIQFKDSFVKELSTYKDISSLSKTVDVKISHSPAALGPIDFLIQDINKELLRLKASNRLNVVDEEMAVLSDKVKKLYSLMSTQSLDAHKLLVQSGLIPKDFGDNLERLKFFLRRIQ